jgi:DNA polymerase-1
MSSSLPPSPRLLLVDGSYYAFRSFYAIQHLSSPEGRPVNALFGMIKALKRMVQDLQPDGAAVIFDVGAPAARLELQADYKANRSDTPMELEEQLPLIRECVPLLGFQSLFIEGEEADDLLASYVEAAKRQNFFSILATNDKDLMQLVDERCSIYQPGKDTFTLLGPGEVEAKWGVPPSQLGDVLALTGDSVDNIPGVPGVGPKTAAKWIREFGSVEGLLAGLEKLPSGKIRDALALSRERVLMNQRMVRLRTELALPVPIEGMRLQPDWAGQVEWFRRLNFKTFLREALAGQSASGAPPIPKRTSAPVPAETQTELFG